jgi:Putative auto-transporter adhesin, head GIN domain
MKKSILAILAFLSLTLSSCIKDKITGEGPVVTQTRSADNFSAIDLRVSGDVFFKQDTVYKLEITAQQNILDVIETHVTNNKLVIKFKNDVNVKSHEPIKIIVSAPFISGLSISGSGNINTQGPVSASSMNMSISGSGNIEMDQLTTGFIDANISGSGNIKVSGGTATEEKLRISGSGNIDLDDVAATRATTTTSGSGDVRVFASQNLSITITGSGSVYYKGNPIINTSISGSGKVIHL